MPTTWTWITAEAKNLTKELKTLTDQKYRIKNIVTNGDVNATILAYTTTLTPYFNNAVTTDVTVSTEAANIILLRVVNTTAATAYLQMFNAVATAVTLGTNAPTHVIRLGANESITIKFTDDLPMNLGGTGLSIAGTTTENGNTTAALSVEMLLL